MKIPFFVLGFGFVLSVAGLAAQTTQQQPTTPVNPTTPATRVGDGAQSKAGTPVQPATTAPATTGGVSGAASSSTAQSPDTTDSAGGVSAMTDSDLQSQIQTALSKEPTLTGDSARVNVSGDTVELAGSVGTNKEKITATRIVQSYAGSKKLVNKLTIGGRSEKGPSSDGRNTANPANNNPEPNKGTPPAGSKPPL
ncbi:MAG TPA: BON domain-containing protein [Candidatus Angelobacter sp.]|nr:BON domain-containing protein [Candidatus Angelobacter sp.]